MKSDGLVIECDLPQASLARQRIVVCTIVAGMGSALVFVAGPDQGSLIIALIVTIGLTWAVDARTRQAIAHGYFIRIYEDRFEVAEGKPSRVVSLDKVARFRETEDGRFAVLKDGEMVSMPSGWWMEPAYRILLANFPADFTVKPLYSR